MDVIRYLMLTNQLIFCRSSQDPCTNLLINIPTILVFIHMDGYHKQWYPHHFQPCLKKFPWTHNLSLVLFKYHSIIISYITTYYSRSTIMPQACSCISTCKNAHQYALRIQSHHAYFMHMHYRFIICIMNHFHYALQCISILVYCASCSRH